MALSVATNTSAATAHRYLKTNDMEASRSLAKLSSGSRIVRASDDAASLAVGTKLKADVNVLRQAQVNASHGSSVLQVADGALQQVSDILIRMKALATQAVTGSISDTERGYLNSEFTELAAQLDDLATQTNGGRLRIDESTLDSQLLGRLEDVRRVFEFTANATSGDLAVYSRSNALSDLAFTVAITDADADGKPETATFDGVPAVVDGGMIEGAAGTAYEGVKLIWTGQGSTAIDLSVSQGLADRLYNAIDEALDRVDGPIERAIGELETAYERFARQIERIEERASRARELLIERLTAMESALSLAATMLSQIRAQMDAMNQND